MYAASAIVSVQTPTHKNENKDSNNYVTTISFILK